MIALLVSVLLCPDLDLKRLRDPDPIVRRQAARALAHVGDADVPALLRARRDPDLDVRRFANAALDRICRRSLKGERRYPAYTVPKNKMTKRLQRIRGVQPQLLAHNGFIKSTMRHYRGGLEQWRRPTLVDYNDLLLTLAGYVRRSTRAVQGRDDNVLETILAAHALAWCVHKFRPGLARDHWTTRWIVERDLIPALQEAATRRGGLTTVERTLIAPLADHITPIVKTAPRSASIHAALARLKRALAPTGKP